MVRLGVGMFFIWKEIIVYFLVVLFICVVSFIILFGNSVFVVEVGLCWVYECIWWIWFGMIY